MTNLELLRKHIEQYIPITDQEFEQFTTNFHHRKIKKKAFLLREDDICQYEAFVTKGCFRIYYLDEKGYAQILYFAVEGWWATDIDSFTNQRPSILNIEALEDSEVLLINKPHKDILYDTLPKVEKMFRIMNQKSLVTLQRRIISSLGKTADKRYLEFIEKYPDLAQRLNQQQLAAYLGISHEFLSKIRKKLAGK
ncbi:Crp/Fnr family transcriptional regulator [Chitinophaga nivalis]|uniref:Crp/Fnr family transcriptional regulator n=1 Tax=Chitinophaga nivalis TaxID=2991709 RepID=A0ABT3IKT4_9BACT|nr:Crp/Fnr family transcriptional regulator [Chitinophaga nivalis]MCW3465935.1 Crp/Fnr family transcriptional regulator [Chitinophaga nivalis]MCW3484374.1 Crp/Fnr family transcriptional regulator [Chitinophaga nivalis]